MTKTPMSKITVRRMRPEDVGAVMALGIKTIEIQTGSDLEQFYSQESLLRWLRRRDSILLVAYVGSDFAGFRLADYNPANRLAYLEMVAIHPAFRMQGVWRALFNKTIKILRDKGCEQVWCIVREDNDAMQAILKREGFSPGTVFRSYEKNIV